MHPPRLAYGHSFLLHPKQGVPYQASRTLAYEKFVMVFVVVVKQNLSYDRIFLNNLSQAEDELKVLIHLCG